MSGQDTANPSRLYRNKRECLLTMPASATNAQRIHRALRACSVRLVATLPETWLVEVVRLCEQDPAMLLVCVAKEEEAVGIAAGAHLAGERAALLMQNHGLLQSVNGIVSLAQLYRIPLVMLVSYRGSFGERDPWHAAGGRATEPVLRALSIPYELVEGPEEIEPRIAATFALAESSQAPVALLLTRGLMWED